MITFRAPRSALALGEIVLIALASIGLVAFTGSPAEGTPTEPVPVSTTAYPTGTTAAGPWVLNASGTVAWTIGSFSGGGGTTLSLRRDTGVYTSTASGQPESTLAATASAASNVAAFVVRHSSTWHQIQFLDMATGTRGGAKSLLSDELASKAMAFNQAGTLLYLGTTTVPGRIYKISAPTAASSSVLNLPAGAKDVSAVAMNGTTLVATTNSSPVRVYPVTLSTFALGTGVTLASSVPVLVDPVVIGDVAYFGTEQAPGRITAIDLTTLTVTDSITFAADETGARSLAVDPDSGILYATTDTPTGPRLVSLSTKPLTRVGMRDLGAGTSATSALVTAHTLDLFFVGARGMQRLSIAPAPSAPPSIAVTERDRGLAVSWVAPPSIEPITRYDVTLSNGTLSATCTTTTLGCDFSGLANGTSYSVSVTASSLAGTSAATRTTASPGTVPSAPVLPRATRGNRSLDVSWSTADLGGRPLLDYTATASPGGHSCTATTTGCTIDGLDNGTAYSVRVVARTAWGVSSASVESSPVTPATTPDLISAPVVTRRDQSLVIDWAPPASDGGDAITGYRVWDSDSGQTVCSTAQTRCVASGLENGVPHRYSVAAVNTVGESAPTMSVAIAAARRPSPPASMTAIRGNASVSLSWNAPTGNAGVPTTGYRVTSTDGSGACVTVETTCTITGLRNGTPVRFVVVAENEMGASDPSPATASVTPATIPQPVNDVVVARLDRSLTLSWVGPTDDGGERVTGFRVIDIDTKVDVCSVVETACTVTGLVNGEPHRYAIVALNAMGGSSPADSLTVAAARRPSPPTAVSAVRGNASALVSWTPPEGNAGVPVIGYRVTTTDGMTVCTTTATTCSVTGLTNGARYRFAVVADNEMGASDTSLESDAIVPATVPDTVRSIATIRGDGLIHLDWDPPADDGGDAVLDYRVVDADTGATVCASTTVHCTVDGLTNGTSYRLAVSARNSVGASAPATSVAAIPARKPHPVTAVVATRGNGSATVSWTAPSGNTGVPVLAYRVVLGSGDPLCVTAETTCVIDNLSNGTPYRFSVIADNEVGASDVSTPSDAVVPATTPGSPSSLFGTDGNGTAAVAWGAPTDDGGAAVESYHLTLWWSGSVVREWDAIERTTIIDRLTNGLEYALVVAARNAVGLSPATVPIGLRPVAPIPTVPVPEIPLPPTSSPTPTPTSTSSPSPSNSAAPTSSPTPTPTSTSKPVPVQSPPPSTVPGQPTGIVPLAVTLTKVTVGWTAPSDGGRPITDYRIAVASSIYGPFRTVSDGRSALPFAVLYRPRNSALVVRVTAVNSRGASRPSVATVVYTPKTTVP